VGAEVDDALGQQGSGASVHGAGEGSGRDKRGGGVSAFLGAAAPRPSFFDSNRQFRGSRDAKASNLCTPLHFFLFSI